MKDPIAPQRLDALTGIRGIASCWMVCFHFQEPLHALLPLTKSLDWVIGAGRHGVSLFFLLSGLILIHTYQSRFATFTWKEYGRYLWFRFARVYPAYLAAMGMMVACVIASEIKGIPRNAAVYPLSVLPWEVLMLHQWVPSHPFGWNFPDWSVSAEWFAYLAAFPCTLWLLKHLKHWIGQVILLALFVATVILFTLDGNWPLAYVTLLFVSGGLLWTLRQTAERQCGIPKFTDVTGLVVVLVGLWLQSLGGGKGWLGMCFAGFCFILVGLSQSGALIARLLAWPAMVFLGEVSYSVYLTHGIVQRVVKVLLPYEGYVANSLPVRVAVLATYGILVLATAVGLYYLVERPSRRWLRDLSKDWWKPKVIPKVA